VHSAGSSEAGVRYLDIATPDETGPVRNGLYNPRICCNNCPFFAFTNLDQSENMRYAIITNPASGRLGLRQKRKLLEKAARILDAQVMGLDVKTRQDFAACAGKAASSVDILVVAGGDGTVSDIINAVDTSQTPIAYLPLGSGNALAHALKYPRGISRVARRIKEGRIREYDLLLCDGRKKAFLASVGIEGTVLRNRDHYLAQGVKGFMAYSRAFLEAYFLQHRPFRAEIEVDDKFFRLNNLLSVLVVKHPCYGYGMNLVPRARFDDRALHVFCAEAGLVRTAWTVVSAFTVGNRLGTFLEGRKVVIRLEEPLVLQTDGDPAWEAHRFAFEVLPKALKIKC
jgi:diacylglycerol kinase (ATP)